MNHPRLPEPELYWQYIIDPPPRFLTIEDGDAYLHGDFTKAIYKQDQRYADAPYEFGLVIGSHAMLKAIAPNPCPSGESCCGGGCHEPHNYD